MFVPVGHVAIRVVAVDRETRITGADVTVDGVSVGPTTYDAPIKTGMHEITVRATDGRSASWTGEVKTAFALRLDVGAPERPTEPGSLAPVHIDSTIKRRLAPIQACYERELPKKPHLGGKIVVNFSILANGSVEFAQIKSSTMGDHSVEACVTREFLEIQFDANPGTVTVNYPLLFKTS